MRRTKWKRDHSWSKLKNKGKMFRDFANLAIYQLWSLEMHVRGNTLKNEIYPYFKSKCGAWVQGVFIAQNGKIELNINVWLKNATQICPRMLENTSQRVSNFKFLPGEHAPGPLEGCVAPQHAVLATQAQFTSASYSVQIRHLLHFLLTTMVVLTLFASVSSVLSHNVASLYLLLLSLRYNS